MSRKDNKGRILRTGESQRKDGSYMYRYTDPSGKRITVYSWRLTESDKNPVGKKSEKSLRSIEQDIVKEQYVQSSVTVNTLFDSFLDYRTDLKQSTKSNYICLYDAHVRNTIGNKQADRVKYTDIYSLYLDLIENGLKIATVKTINTILYQLFYNAERDRQVNTNPVDGAMKKLLKTNPDRQVKREALTVDQQTQFIRYIYTSPTYNKYGPLFTILLGTGMRIGEALGLIWDDVDLTNGMIFVRHAVRYYADSTGLYGYHITKPKTLAGIRTIPMLPDVKTALSNLRHERSNTIDGYTGFVFVNHNGNPYKPGFIFDLMQNIVLDYNREHEQKLPRMSPHILRHTFCTRMCEIEPNVKLIQEVMGHKHLSTTMDVYTDVMEETKITAFQNLGAFTPIV